MWQADLFASFTIPRWNPAVQELSRICITQTTWRLDHQTLPNSIHSVRQMTANVNIPKHLQHLRYAEEHSLLNNELGRVVKHIIQVGIPDDFSFSHLESVVTKHQTSAFMAGAFMAPELDQGEIVLGRDQHGNFIRVPLEHWSHSFTLANAGAGKTTQELGLAIQFSVLMKGVMLFDLMKQEFGKLSRCLPALGVTLDVVPARQLKINPLQVPRSTDPRDYASRIADMLVMTLLPTAPRASKFLHVKILELYQDFDILTGSRNYPTLFDLRASVNADTSGNFQARSAIIDAIDPLLMSIGNVLAYRVGWTDQLESRKIVFQLGSIAEAEKNLILNALILQVFIARVNSGISNPKYKDLWVCCDEASRIVSSHSSSGIVELLSLVRGTGIAMHLSAQSTIGIAPQILSNAVHKFISRCGSAQDYDSVTSAMGLSAMQKQWLMDNACPGLFVGQLGEGWRQPFVLTVPKVNL